MQSMILQSALNHLLEAHQIDIRPLDGKTVYFSLQDLPIAVNFICTNDRIFVTTDATINADVDIKLKSNVFLKLIQGEDLTELLRQDKIMIHGDVKTAQLLVDLLQQVEFDFEEALSKFTGDIVAHQVGKIAKKFKSSDNSLASIKDKITNFLITPKRFH
ncbi:hypothetical protein [uncultured Gammaproteobacteria bacterium]|jgi:ubiquinone biosynthesis protein UbiJ|uniref:Uncharacterized protein n=3 Tax=sulfur-oxidizing symbionts TaxID=32036 RepID=A0ACA8ZR52_9GAMM|nr:MULTISPECIES: SCP2 sterol-binding domain-containing protein [Gammaproteobacteria]CAB5503434.1 hypothetical protein AZO1586I_1123 [Bathymodiolus thermophilus thioautotrophic gill symbiont]CAC9496104.1 hypothetical protein [uncultured Gammaproteobacteria bacterium]CAB5502649.1 hypothetical protein AZO1586R_1461 [Bathymodiolus azoricus thioautotrophic gill symbiont]CAC9501378.1 hypothetical protein [uncultured Gammaproteobacteria bacterium]CAC9502768.1 hypothetical protein [uncultured Gammapro